ncbi:MAG: FeoA family protein [Eubacteriales bacterium]|nr:FeoA family protein [Eubacteriales bacterium]
MLPLSMADKDRTLKIVRISGKDQVRQHLAELGFVPEAEVKVLADNGGNMIVSIKGGRVAIDRSMANRIMV